MQQVTVLSASEILEKSMHDEHEALVKGKALPEGVVRNWKGKDYTKRAGKWVALKKVNFDAKNTQCDHGRAGKENAGGFKGKASKSKAGRYDSQIKGSKNEGNKKIDLQHADDGKASKRFDASRKGSENNPASEGKEGGQTKIHGKGSEGKTYADQFKQKSGKTLSNDGSGGLVGGHGMH